MLSIMVISLFSFAIDSLSFPLLIKSGLKPGIIPYDTERRQPTECYVLKDSHILMRGIFKRDNYMIRLNWLALLQCQYSFYYNSVGKKNVKEQHIIPPTLVKPRTHPQFCAFHILQS